MKQLVAVVEQGRKRNRPRCDVLLLEMPLQRKGRLLDEVDGKPVLRESRSRGVLAGGRLLGDRSALLTSETAGGEERRGRVKSNDPTRGARGRFSHRVLLEAMTLVVAFEDGRDFTHSRSRAAYPENPSPSAPSRSLQRADSLIPGGVATTIPAPRESGGTGRRAGFRNLWVKPWGFESPLSHQPSLPFMKSYPWIVREAVTCSSRLRSLDRRPSCRRCSSRAAPARRGGATNRSPA